MRKKYIQPVACSIAVEEEDLICASTIKVRISSYKTDTVNGYITVTFEDGTSETMDPDTWNALKESLGYYVPGSSKAISWSDMDVADW